MNTKQIDYCIELSQTLNFSRAAENLFVSQPSFSYQIKLLEDEIGFSIFNRNGKGVSLTPAGEQFCEYLRRMRQELNAAIEQGQNFSAKYKDDISISLSVRQAIYKLPESMVQMANQFPDVRITPKFQYTGSLDLFLKNEADILFMLEDEALKLTDINIHSLFTSPICLISKKDDPLSCKKRITEEDLYGRTLMIGGGSPKKLRMLQQKLISTGKISWFNSPDHDSTLTNVAAGRGVCLAPGFLNDYTNQFSWTPFDTDFQFHCVLCTHKNDRRESLNTYIRILQELYKF